MSPEVPDALPYFLKGANRITAVLGRDGAVVIHWDAFNDSFEFSHSDQTVNQILQEQGIGELENPEHEPPAPVRMSGPVWTMEWGEKRPASRDFGWKNVEVIPASDIDGRTEEAARARAELDVQTFVSAHTMGLAQGDLKETRNKVIAGLEAAVAEFEQVLETHANDEKMIQFFLDTKRNRMLLEPGMIPPLRSEVWIGKNKADFVVELPPGERYLLVEIERPIHKLFTAKDRVTKEVNHAQQQVEDWMNRISEHPHEARETLPGIREPQGWVVIGRRSTMTENQQRVLERRNARTQNITIMTYDDLLDRARQYLENLRPFEP
ncbi:MAG: DUF4263 domain-containing protein [Actinobacteria bacterium]|nr:DUF4263 domain-containing protein [Actinomycetota bacterium]